METRRGTKIPFIEEVREPRAPPKPKVETRTSSLIPLIDEPYVKELTGSRLPLCVEVFCHFFYLHMSQKMGLKEAKRVTVKAVTNFWELISITPKTLDNGICMLTRLHERYKVNTDFNTTTATDITQKLKDRPSNRYG